MLLPLVELVDPFYCDDYAPMRAQAASKTMIEIHHEGREEHEVQI
jgi:hypothetical protein